ncbi:MAG: SMP-30/gluconolactonase/LRE family protein [Pseudomonadota bacterium]
MITQEISEALLRGYGLIEGPVWDPARGLVFSDVLGGGVYCLGEDGSVSTIFEHRKGIGGMALHSAGGLVVSGRNVSFKPFSGGATQLLLDRDPEAGNVGYNDLTTDAAGRIYVGSLGNSPVFEDGREPQAGNLYRIDLDGTTRQVAEDVRLTNGLGFSPDGRTLYHSDSLRRAVFCYPVAEDGDLGEKRLFAELEDGAPDGLAVAEDGSVWVALAAGGHGVAVLETDGTRRAHIAIPDPMCTSVCFGGDQLKTLYIVSGSDGAPSDRHGAVYEFACDVAGVPVAAARVALPE